MKTFAVIHQELFKKVYTSPEGMDISHSELMEQSAKEYAKQWVEEAAMLASTRAANGVDVVNTVMELRNEIDKQ